MGILRKVNKDCLRECLEVVLNSVLHDVIDVDDQLLELCKALMNMVKVAINVHGSPGKGNHAWAKLVLKIFKMRNKQALCVWPDLVDDPVVLSQNEVELTVVHLELVFLKEDDLSALGDINTDTGQALSLTDEGQNFTVEVDVELIVVGVSDYESGLESSLSLLNLMSPLLSPKVLEGEESVTSLVVHLDELL